MICLQICFPRTGAAVQSPPLPGEVLQTQNRNAAEGQAELQRIAARSKAGRELPASQRSPTPVTAQDRGGHIPTASPGTWGLVVSTRSSPATVGPAMLHSPSAGTRGGWGKATVGGAKTVKFLPGRSPFSLPWDQSMPGAASPGPPIFSSLPPAELACGPPAQLTCYASDPTVRPGL